jgi:predicted nucleic acid-binding protein
VIYLDTSALVKLHILESGSETVKNLVAGQSDPLPIWEIQEMELTNALRLKVFWGDINEADANHQIDLFKSRKMKGHHFFPDLDRSSLFDDFQKLSTLTPHSGCRMLDILHVACALQLSPDLFVTFDSRQEALAIKAGLKTVNPGKDQ